jgi:hypothetical protein
MSNATRPFLEAQIRHQVLALPNVKTITARATGLEINDAVNAVCYESDGSPAGRYATGARRTSSCSRWSPPPPPSSPDSASAPAVTSAQTS